MASDLVDDTIAALKASGYVVLKEKSYRQAQERQRVAEALREAAERDAEKTRAWARGHCNEERRLAARLNDVVAWAMTFGATMDDLVAFNNRLRESAGESDGE